MRGTKISIVFSLLALFFYCCNGNIEKQATSPIIGEWQVDSKYNRIDKVNQVLRIDEKYYQELLKESSDSADWSSVTQIYKLQGDTLTTFDINYKTKKLYAWNMWVIVGKTKDQIKLKTLNGDTIALNRIYSNFTTVDTLLDSRLNKIRY